MRTILFLFLCISFLARELWAQEIVDLGVEGAVCKINSTGIDLNSIRQTKPIEINNQVDLQFDGTKHLSKWQTENVQFVLENYPLPKGAYRQNKIEKKTIFVFSALDSSSIEKAKEIKADYGLCIAYNSLEDIKAFREKSGAPFPIALGNMNIIRFFKINSCPCLITIQKGEVTVETDI